MNLAELTLPEVQAHAQTAEFFRQGNHDYVKISFVGSKDNHIKKVTPEHMAKFRPAWDAYCDGRPLERRPGTPLTDLPSINEARANEYVLRNVHNLEELAVLNDGQCQSLGHGTLTDRQNAKGLLATRQFQQRETVQRTLKEKQSTVGAAVDEKAQADIDALKTDVAELRQGIGQIMELLQKRKGGRPKKAAE